MSELEWTMSQENHRLVSVNESLRADVKRLEEALREIMQWGVEQDDARLKYITVQVDRADIEKAQEALGRIA